MSERRAVEKLVERIYKDRLKRTGRLPSGKETREIEGKAKKAAMDTENKGSRK